MPPRLDYQCETKREHIHFQTHSIAPSSTFPLLFPLPFRSRTTLNSTAPLRGSRTPLLLVVLVFYFVLTNLLPESSFPSGPVRRRHVHALIIQIPLPLPQLCVTNSGLGPYSYKPARLLRGRSSNMFCALPLLSSRASLCSTLSWLSALPFRHCGSAVRTVTADVSLFALLCPSSGLASPRSQFRTI
ncbi:hypothetical protein BGY98DRAFT_1027677, partial [Russula aff. rugulosa BPL654]